MDQITETSYYARIRDMAKELFTDAMEQHDNDTERAQEYIQDEALHETIDGTDWAVYTCYHLPILQFSNNSDAYIDEFGAQEAGEIIKEHGLDNLHAAIAFWAMYRDVQAEIDWLIELHNKKTEKEEVSENPELFI